MIESNYKERSKIGNFFYKLTTRFASFLMKHMWLYYVLNYTWGLLTTIWGWLAYLFIRIFLKNKIVEHGVLGPCHYAMFGDNWGGLELGTNFALADNMGKQWTLHTKQHEMGHTFQSCLYGPFIIFLVFIPSVTRYWLERAGKLKHDYDYAWFEESASNIGKEYYENYPIRQKITSIYRPNLKK